MALCLEEILFESPVPTRGMVVTKYGHTMGQELQHVTVAEAGHPVPDENGVKATTGILDLLDTTTERTLVLAVVSGGGSALLSAPAESLCLDDLQAVNKVLIACGAPIQDINTIRKHLSAVKGGQLLRRAAPSQCVTLILSDVVGDPLNVIASGPTVADPTTFETCLEIISKYGVAEALPRPVMERLVAGARGDIPDTPKPGDPLFLSSSTVLIGTNALALQEAADTALGLGYTPLVLTSTLEGEAREVAKVIAAIARETAAHGRPIQVPAAILAGGETTVTITGAGKGGRNQELALAMALALEGEESTFVLAGGTDGTDGPTEATGAMVHGGTAGNAREMGLDPAKSLMDNDSNGFFNAFDAESLVITGPTGTNVADLLIVLVGEG